MHIIHRRCMYICVLHNNHLHVLLKYNKAHTVINRWGERQRTVSAGFQGSVRSLPPPYRVKYDDALFYGGCCYRTSQYILVETRALWRSVFNSGAVILRTNMWYSLSLAWMTYKLKYIMRHRAHVFPNAHPPPEDNMSFTQLYRVLHNTSTKWQTGTWRWTSTT